MPDPSESPAQSRPRPAPAAVAAPAAAPVRKKVIVVDELTERHVQVNHTSVTFRPGQVLTDPYAIQLATDNNIALRER